MTRLQQLWKRIIKTIAQLRLRKAAKNLIWVDDEPQADIAYPAGRGETEMRTDLMVPGSGEKIRTESFPYDSIDNNGAGIYLRNHQDIDFTRQDNLDEYFQEMTVTKEALQSWISVGILSPHEVRIAEKWIKIMRARDREQLRRRSP